MSDQDSDKTEQPTAQKIEEARKEGDVHRSKDLSNVLTLLLWFIMVWMLAGYLYSAIATLFHAVFTQLHHPSLSALTELLLLAAQTLLLAILPLIVSASVVGTLIEFLQIGKIVSFKKLQPKLQNLDPVQGIKKIVSKDNLVEVLKAVFKCAVLIVMVCLIIRSQSGQLGLLPYATVSAVIATLWHCVVVLITGVLSVFVFVALLDAAYQRHAYIKKLMMSTRDIQQEMKNSEGDPLLKGERKQLHQEWAQDVAFSAVRTASAVVTNPTHLAVAIRYDKADADSLPRVVAKGGDHQAALIRKVAEDAGVPVLQNIDLARGLYRDIDIDQFISPAFFKAVAEVLRWAEQVRDNQQH